MAGQHAVLMMCHYFCTTLLDEQKQEVCLLIDGSDKAEKLQITPARLEQLCAEYGTVDGLIQKLRELAIAQKIAADEPLLSPPIVNAEASLNVLNTIAGLSALAR